MLIIPGRQQRHITMRTGPVHGLADYLRLQRGVLYRASGVPDGDPARLTKLVHPRRDEMVARYEAAHELATNERAQIDGVITQAARFISAEYVPGHCMDHEDPVHMKASLEAGLYESKPIHSMHDADPLKWCGAILESHWDDVPRGALKSPGVAGIVGIDNTLPHCAAMARGVSFKSLTRLSLGFIADFHPSHPEMSGWEFLDFVEKLGTPAPDGTLFRFIVDGMPDVLELSFVDIGAVPSARTTDAPGVYRAHEAAPVAKESTQPAARRMITPKPATVAGPPKEITRMTIKAVTMSPEEAAAVGAACDACAAECATACQACADECMAAFEAGDKDAAMAACQKCADACAAACAKCKAACESAVGGNEGLAAEAEALRATAAEAVTLRATVTTHETALTTLRAETERLKPLAALGEAATTARRERLRAAFAVIRGGVDKIPAAVALRITSGTVDDLDVIEATLPADSLATPKCAACGKDAAEYRSSVAPTAETLTRLAAKVRAEGERPTGREKLAAATAHHARATAKDPQTTMTYDDALRSVRAMSDVQIFQLADEAEQLAPAVPTT